MKVKCTICDQIDVIDDQDPKAKQLRNRPIHTYMCATCYDRITDRTIERWETGRFKIPHHKQQVNDEW